MERRIEEELSRSSGRRRFAEDKEEKEQRGTIEHKRKRKRERTRRKSRRRRDGVEREEAEGMEEEVTKQ